MRNQKMTKPSFVYRPRHSKAHKELYQSGCDIFKNGITAIDAPANHPARVYMIKHLIQALNTLAFQGSDELGVERFTWRDHKRAQFILNFLLNSSEVHLQAEEIEHARQLINDAVTARSARYRFSRDERRYREQREGLSVFDKPAHWTKKFLDDDINRYEKSYKKLQSKNNKLHEQHKAKVKQALEELIEQNLKPTLRAIAEKIGTTNLKSISNALSEITSAKNSTPGLTSTTKLSRLLDSEAFECPQGASQ